MACSLAFFPGHFRGWLRAGSAFCLYIWTYHPLSPWTAQNILFSHLSIVCQNYFHQVPVYNYNHMPLPTCTELRGLKGPATRGPSVLLSSPPVHLCCDHGVIQKTSLRNYRGVGFSQRVGRQAVGDIASQVLCPAFIS